ncbi:MAG TPA: YdaS family helix-turn-helix protein [Gammaproteobacteria bacterium]|nr:YdaS family helix-turn-helix protein [Gammaproteobacteria bacterium]
MDHATENIIDLACKCVGGQAELARRIGVRPQSIHKWRKKGVVPAERVLGIEQATGRRVTRHQLRPDLYPVEDSDETNRVPA